jgi:hypothetical protein
MQSISTSEWRDGSGLIKKKKIENQKCKKAEKNKIEV